MQRSHRLCGGVLSVFLNYFLFISSQEHCNCSEFSFDALSLFFRSYAMEREERMTNGKERKKANTFRQFRKLYYEFLNMLLSVAAATAVAAMVVLLTLIDV